MKQQYSKPVLIKETFTLSQSIAKNCGRMLDFSHATQADTANCGWDVDGNINTRSDVIFMEAADCTIKTLYIQGVCYNNPAGGFNVFNS